MSDWVPEGYINVAALARARGVEKVRSDLYSGRLAAFRWDGTTGKLNVIEPTLWCSDDAEEWLASGMTRRYARDDSPSIKIVVRVEDEPNPPPATDGVYQPPFMVLMLDAVRHFKISEQCCPKKEVLEEYFRKQKVDGKPVSANLASYLATFCRPPAAMRGGNRKKG